MPDLTTMREAISYGQTLLNLNPEEARVATGIFARMFPADEHGPGATEIGDDYDVMVT
jgi:hypothetical protein